MYNKSSLCQDGIPLTAMGYNRLGVPLVQPYNSFPPLEMSEQPITQKEFEDLLGQFNDLLRYKDKQGREETQSFWRNNPILQDWFDSKVIYLTPPQGSPAIRARIPFKKLINFFQSTFTQRKSYFISGLISNNPFIQRWYRGEELNVADLEEPEELSVITDRELLQIFLTAITYSSFSFLEFLWNENSRLQPLLKNLDPEIHNELHKVILEKKNSFSKTYSAWYQNTCPNKLQYFLKNNECYTKLELTNLINSHFQPTLTKGQSNTQPEALSNPRTNHFFPYNPLTSQAVTVQSSTIKPIKEKEKGISSVSLLNQSEFESLLKQFDSLMKNPSKIGETEFFFIRNSVLENWYASKVIYLRPHEKCLSIPNRIPFRELITFFESSLARKKPYLVNKLIEINPLIQLWYRGKELNVADLEKPEELSAITDRELLQVFLTAITYNSSFFLEILWNDNSKLQTLLENLDPELHNELHKAILDKTQSFRIVYCAWFQYTCPNKLQNFPKNDKCSNKSHLTNLINAHFQFIIIKKNFPPQPEVFSNPWTNHFFSYDPLTSQSVPVQSRTIEPIIENERVQDGYNASLVNLLSQNEVTSVHPVIFFQKLSTAIMSSDEKDLFFIETVVESNPLFKDWLKGKSINVANLGEPQNLSVISDQQLLQFFLFSFYCKKFKHIMELWEDHTKLQNILKSLDERLHQLLHQMIINHSEEIPDFVYSYLDWFEQTCPNKFENLPTITKKYDKKTIENLIDFYFRDQSPTENHCAPQDTLDHLKDLISQFHVLLFENKDKKRIDKFLDENQLLLDWYTSKPISIACQNFSKPLVIPFEHLLDFFHWSIQNKSCIGKKLWDNNPRLQAWYSGKPVDFAAFGQQENIQTIPFAKLLSMFQIASKFREYYLLSFLWKNNDCLKDWYCQKEDRIDNLENRAAIKKEICRFFILAVNSLSSTIYETLWDNHPWLRENILSLDSKNSFSKQILTSTTNQFIEKYKTALENHSASQISSSLVDKKRKLETIEKVSNKKPKLMPTKDDGTINSFPGFFSTTTSNSSINLFEEVFNFEMEEKERDTEALLNGSFMF